MASHQESSSQLLDIDIFLRKDVLVYHKTLARRIGIRFDLNLTSFRESYLRSDITASNAVDFKQLLPEFKKEEIVYSTVCFFPYFSIERVRLLDQILEEELQLHLSKDSNKTTLYNIPYRYYVYAIVESCTCN